MSRKICFIVTDYNSGGGTERVLSQVANGLVVKGYDVSIVSLGHGKQPQFYTNDKIALYELNVMPVAQKSKLGFWCNKLIMSTRKAKAIQNILMQICPNIAVVAGIGFYRYIERARKKLKIKTIAWEHFCLSAYNLPQINKSRRLAVKKADKLIVLSDGDLLAYQQKYPKAVNLMRIYNPIAFDITNNIDINNKVIVAAGRYVYEKGFDMLIEAWKEIAHQVGDWEIRIFGEGIDRNNLQKQIDTYNLKNIKLCGYAQSLDKEYEKASIFCLSSRYEGWGLVLVEAQAKGLPCISFDCKNGPREIIEDGVNGFLIKANDTEEFAKKLLFLIQSKETRQLFSCNSQKALHKFKTENIINEWNGLIKTLLDDNH